MYNSCVLMARQFLTPRGSVWHTQAGLAALDWDSKEKPKIWGKHHDDRGGSGISLDWEVNALLASSVYAKTAFFFLLFYFLFLFSHRVEVERGGGGREEGCCSAGSPLVCHLGQCLSPLGGQAWTHPRSALMVCCTGRFSNLASDDTNATFYPVIVCPPSHCTCLLFHL